MKLATLRNGRPDGHLVVVSRDNSRYVSAGRVAPNLQSALDDWAEAAPKLGELYAQLNSKAIAAQPFEPELALAPLPRAFQWIDGAAYLGHLDRVRSLKGSKDAQLQSHTPLMYQGASDCLSSPTAPIVAPEDDLAIDFEAEVAAILGPVPMAADKTTAQGAIRLFALCNDVSFRRLVYEDLTNGFGFFHAKPSTAFAPIVVTPDECGDAWASNKLSVTVSARVNDTQIGRLDAGLDMDFDFADMIVAATRTRALGTGTILGAGTIANRHDEALPLKPEGRGFACLAEARTVEKAKYGKARTPFLRVGDRVRLSATDRTGNSVFGEINQRVELLRQA